MRAICLWLAAAGFVASAVLHLLSFTPWAFLAGERIIWTLGVLGFALAAAMVARLRRTAALGRRWARVAVYDWRGLVRAGFDVSTGDVLRGPAERSVQVYPVRVQGDALVVDVPSAS